MQAQYVPETARVSAFGPLGEGAGDFTSATATSDG
jgi:hypothetical protein